MRKDELTSMPETLYLGGGSPSILNDSELSQLFAALNMHFDLSRIKEITIETNPDDHQPDKLLFWRKLGINRLSIGIQSYIDRDLILMNRAHSAFQAKYCIENARAAGFDSLTIDLIYGIPGQSFAEWQQNIETTIGLHTDHISAYCLTIEKKTALHYMVAKGELKLKDDDQIEQEYLYLHRTLESRDYGHYEISNFAKPEKKALHNSNYWSGKPYLGIGPAAHSFNGINLRKWNISHNAMYIQAINNGTPYWEEERLTAENRVNEQLMTGLRTATGLDISEMPLLVQNAILQSADKMPRSLNQMLEIDRQNIKIKPEYWLMTDQILPHLFINT